MMIPVKTLPFFFEFLGEACTSCYKLTYLRPTGECKDVGYMAIRFEGNGSVSLHVHIDKGAFNHIALRHMKHDFNVLKDYLYRRGIRVIVAVADKQTEEEMVLWERFVRHFNFSEPHKIMTSHIELTSEHSIHSTPYPTTLIG